VRNARRVARAEAGDQLLKVGARDGLVKAARVRQKVKELAAGRELERHHDDILLLAGRGARVHAVIVDVIQAQHVRRVDFRKRFDFTRDLLERRLALFDRILVEQLERDLCAGARVGARVHAAKEPPRKGRRIERTEREQNA
jgi:hypothetical protein